MNIKKAKLPYIILAVILLAVIINPLAIGNLLNKILSVLSPIIIGIAAAFVMNAPICKIYSLSEKLYNKYNSKPLSPFFCTTSCKAAANSYTNRTIWLFSVAVGYFALAAAFIGIIMIIVPQLVNSVRLLYSNADFYREQLEKYYSVLAKKDALSILPSIASYADALTKHIPDIAAAAYGKTADILGTTADFIIGLVLSVYILTAKESLRVNVKKLFRRFLNSQNYLKCAYYYKLIYDIFSRFVKGQFTEALILGGLCFVGMTLFGFGYPLLISTIIGITALIPVAGAIVGTVPCAFLLFLSEPSQAVWFVAFIIALQQLENNLIYPRVVGKSMGLPPLPVLIAILIGAKIGGAVGILLAVPLCAVIFGIFNTDNPQQAQ